MGRRFRADEQLRRDIAGHHELHDQRHVRADHDRSNGSITLTDDANGSPHTIALSGTGTDFTVTAPATVTDLPC